MNFRKLNILASDVVKARQDMYTHPDELVQRRVHCLVLKSLFYPDEQIAAIMDISRQTVKSYLDLYASEGYQGLLKTQYHKPKSELEDYTKAIEEDFKQQPPQTLKEAKDRIEQLTGIDRSINRVHQFLKKIGMKRLKTGQIPGKANTVKQQEFHDNTLQPLLKKAKKGKIEVFFMDAAHFVLNAFVGMLWCFARVFIKAPSGRFRLNVLAAMNAVSKQITGVTNETYVTATTVIDLLEQLAVQYKGRKIYIILDNARYQHCQAVKAAALSLKINLVFLPTYSPNLNLIERLWKYVKSEVCATQYYEDASQFKNAILDFLNNLDTPQRSKEMQTRMTLNFQLFSNV
jgi:transposase